ncbi:hypothetical protein HDR58_11255 [bacterium]|nr:hypothetical protein [bacterium]
MRNDYEMVTLRDYVENLDNVKCTSVAEYKIEKEVEKYLLNQRRNETNAKIVEALLA